MTEGNSDTARLFRHGNRSTVGGPGLLPSWRGTRRLVAVSTGLHRRRREARFGGLAVAIRSALQESGGVWFGGAESRRGPTDEPGIAVDGPLTFATLDLSRRITMNTYRYANRVLCFIPLPQRACRVLARYLAGYLPRQSNVCTKPGANAVAEDLVWVHDYHLIPS